MRARRDFTPCNHAFSGNSIVEGGLLLPAVVLRSDYVPALVTRYTRRAFMQPQHLPAPSLGTSQLGASRTREPCAVKRARAFSRPLSFMHAGMELRLL